MDTKTTNPRETARMIQEWGDAAQAAWAGKTAQTSFDELAGHSKDLIATLNRVVTTMAAIKFVWSANEMDARIASRDIPDGTLTWEQLVEQSVAYRALEAFLNTPLEILPATEAMPAVMISPMQMMFRREAPRPYWSLAPLQPAPGQEGTGADFEDTAAP